MKTRILGLALTAGVLSILFLGGGSKAGVAQAAPPVICTAVGVEQDGSMFLISTSGSYTVQVNSDGDRVVGVCEGIVPNKGPGSYTFENLPCRIRVPGGPMIYSSTGGFAEVGPDGANNDDKARGRLTCKGRIFKCPAIDGRQRR